MTPFETYRQVYVQGFVPIFVSDRFDAVALAEAAVQAGARVVEITCRRAEVCDDIRRVRSAFPDLGVLVGSTVDDGPLLNFLRRKRPDMPSLARLADLGVDGFVSMMPISPATIERWHDSHLLIPAIETASEAVTALNAGAHFVKIVSTPPQPGDARIASLTSAPMHGLLPIFATGGVSVARIGDFIRARAALLGSGWDLILGDHYLPMQEQPDLEAMAEQLARFLAAIRAARKQAGLSTYDHPQLLDLDALPHYHPFGPTAEADA